ncbi:MAG: hypothetical protein OEZ68_20145 [Gammaproteobacteria bacterium]|nr:hypothetical protein [Gammaproteobacteria bacterium]MDH5803121.1 hypothetical protein [Gammaproteobacteria bacterium]
MGDLESKDSILCYRENPYTGIVLCLVDGVVVEKKTCRAGVIEGDYSLPFPLYVTSTLEVHAALLEGDEEPFLFSGKEFNGVAYSLNNGRDSVVKQYENGEEVSLAKYKNGVLVNLEHVESDGSLSQDYVWDQAGNIVDFSLNTLDDVQIAIHLDSERRVTLLTIWGDYFGKLDSIGNLVLVKKFDRSDFVKSMSAGESLYLSGAGVSGDMFNELVLDGGLDLTKKIQIYNTKITTDSLKRVLALNNLTEIYIESDVISPEELRAYKLKHPDCYVRYNGEEIS